jgi:hypothetical protein
MTLADLNALSPADLNATPWVATPDGSWTRMVGVGVNRSEARELQAAKKPKEDAASRA